MIPESKVNAAGRGEKKKKSNYETNVIWNGVWIM